MNRDKLEFAVTESNFFYLGELSDADLLQSLTDSKSADRKSTLLTK